VVWQALRLTGQEALSGRTGGAPQPMLAARASKRLQNEELLIREFGPSPLRRELDRVPLWRGDHVPIGQLMQDFASYLYLSRLRDSSVLAEAIRKGFSLLTWEQDSFAYADSYDEQAGRYRGLRCGETLSVSENDPGLLVRPEAALRQREAEVPVPVVPVPVSVPGGGSVQPVVGPGGNGGGGGVLPPVVPPPPTRRTRRYHGTVTLDSSRAGRDASKVADEVIAHLQGLVGSSVRVTLEIEAEFADGVPDHVIRTVTENGRTLKFTSQGFEVE